MKTYLWSLIALALLLTLAPTADAFFLLGRRNVTRVQVNNFNGNGFNNGRANVNVNVNRGFSHGGRVNVNLNNGYNNFNRGFNGYSINRVNFNFSNGYSNGANFNFNNGACPQYAVDAFGNVVRIR